jgi:NDP-sugar pyrophosphorylase family protein
MKIIIPMSGKGQRFINSGYKLPKPLIEVDGIPIIKHIIDLFPGENDIHCICNEEHINTTHMKTLLETYNCKIHVIKPHSLGPVYAVSKIFDIINDDEEVIISYCDYGTIWDYKQFLEYIKDSSIDGAIAAYKGFHPHMLGTDNYAFLKLNNGYLEEIREKEHFTNNRMDEYASNGTYYFKRGEYIKKYFTIALNNEEKYTKNGEYYVSLIYNIMVKDNKKIIPFEIKKMLQWGTPYDLEIYNMWSSHFKEASIVKETYNSSATLILPFAGKGSRFSMDGYNTPKPLLDINNKHMIIRAIESIPKCNNNILVCLKEHLTNTQYNLYNCLNNNIPNSKIIDISSTTEGQACTCKIAIDTIYNKDTPILISACDNGVDYDANEYAKLENNNDIDVIIWSFTNNPTSKINPNMYAWLDVDSDGNILDVSVKKYIEGRIHAIIGTMFFRKASIFLEGYNIITSQNIRTNGEFYVDDLINPLIKLGYKIKVFPVNRYICWGTPNDYKTYNYWYDHFKDIYSTPYIM